MAQRTALLKRRPTRFRPGNAALASSLRIRRRSRAGSLRQSGSLSAWGLSTDRNHANQHAEKCSHYDYQTLKLTFHQNYPPQPFLEPGDDITMGPIVGAVRPK